MPSRVHFHPHLIFSVGTQVVTLREILGQNGRTLQPRGSVGVVVAVPTDLNHAYRVRFPDGVEETMKPSELTSLAKFKEGGIYLPPAFRPGVKRPRNRASTTDWKSTSSRTTPKSFSS